MIAFPVSAQEVILDYHSDIEVLENSSVIVEETIKVQAEGKKIKRGIYRDFPTDYKDNLGNYYKVGFKLLSVQRDGRSESYHTEQKTNGIRIYIGNKNVYLKKGVYTYKIRYQTTRQLGFFDEHDELYWNVTGNDWDFPIQKASASVRLPAGVYLDGVNLQGYTGYQGATGQDYLAEIDSGYGLASFSTTRTLGKREGFTIVVAWPKGFVIEPTSEQKLSWFFNDNQAALAGVVGIIVILAYYFLVWRIVGKDPETGVIIPLYKPAADYSPASMRFIRRMGYDNKVFAAAILNLAVKGYIKIKEKKEGKFTLTKTGELAKLAPGEGAIASALFGGVRNSITLEQSKHKVIGKAIKVHKGSLKRDYERIYFKTNTLYLVPGLILSVLCIVITLSLLPREATELAAFFTVWLSVWTVGVIYLAINAILAWTAALKGGSYMNAVGLTLFATPFFIGEVGALYVLNTQAPPAYFLTLLTVIIINFMFYQWMKAPTLAGRRLLDQVDGFRLYLSVAEKDELNMKHPPDKTPELFEKYLPYAIALDVEQEWAEKFNDVLMQANIEEQSYHPAWYNGRSWSHNSLTSFSGAMGSAMSSAISSSSTAPGSSSGGGGGGSSGGGGGGGGGGGW